MIFILLFFLIYCFDEAIISFQLLINDKLRVLLGCRIAAIITIEYKAFKLFY